VIGAVALPKVVPLEGRDASEIDGGDSGGREVTTIRIKAARTASMPMIHHEAGARFGFFADGCNIISPW